jgi:hypothetical protein
LNLNPKSFRTAITGVVVVPVNWRFNEINLVGRAALDVCLGSPLILLKLTQRRERFVILSFNDERESVGQWQRVLEDTTLGGLNGLFKQLAEGWSKLK